MSPPPSPTPTIYTGTFISTPTPSSLDIWPNHAVVVDGRGVVRHRIALPVDGGGDVGGWVRGELGLGEGWGWVRGEGGWWFPGFVGEWGVGV